MATEDKNLHAGHRERVRERIKTGGINCLSDVEFLEYILFCTIPQGNTNPIAHKLINTFGSIERVFEASLDQLMAVEGIGKKSAELLSTYLPAFKRYTQKVSQPKTAYDSPDKVIKYFQNECMGHQVEHSYALYLNQSHRIIKNVHFTKGTFNKTSIFVDQVVKEAITLNARYVVVAHNHTSGTVYPSQADCITSQSLEKALNLVKKELMDFVILDHFDYFSFYDHKMLGNFIDVNPYTGSTDEKGKAPASMFSLGIHDDDAF